MMKPTIRTSPSVPTHPRVERLTNLPSSAEVGCGSANNPAKTSRTSVMRRAEERSKLILFSWLIAASLPASVYYNGVFT